MILNSSDGITHLTIILWEWRLQDIIPLTVRRCDICYYNIIHYFQNQARGCVWNQKFAVSRPKSSY